MRQRLILLLFLVTCSLTLLPVVLILTLANSESRSQEETSAEERSLTVGVILTGDAADFGWEGFNGSQATYAELQLSGQRVILLDHVSSLGRPEMTLHEAVAGVLDRGATVVFISSAHLTAADTMPITEQYPNTVFIMNVATRADVERLFAVLPEIDADINRLGAVSAGQDVDLAGSSAGSGLDENDAESASGIGLVLCALSVIIVVVVVVGRTLVYAQSTTVPEHRKTGGRDRKRKRGTGGINVKGLTIEDAVRDHMTDFAAMGDPAPLIHKLSTYVAGDLHFDESFQVEQGDAFLGECGLSITQTVNRYAPDKVTALEVWMFDKNDTRTATHVLASDHAAESSSVSAALSKKGPVIRVEPDAVTELETATLRLRARVLSVQYGFSDTLPARSFFEYIVVEIAVFEK